MNCKNCGKDLNTKSCSDMENFMFFTVCEGCKVLNKINIDLGSNQVIVRLADDDELDLAKNLFYKKTERLTSKLVNNKGNKKELIKAFHDIMEQPMFDEPTMDGLVIDGGVNFI